jgi:hypothetical protein
VCCCGCAAMPRQAQDRHKAHIHSRKKTRVVETERGGPNLGHQGCILGQLVLGQAHVRAGGGQGFTVQPLGGLEKLYCGL